MHAPRLAPGKICSGEASTATAWPIAEPELAEGEMTEQILESGLFTPISHEVPYYYNGRDRHVS